MRYKTEHRLHKELRRALPSVLYVVLSYLQDRVLERVERAPNSSGTSWLIQRMDWAWWHHEQPLTYATRGYTRGELANEIISIIKGLGMRDFNIKSLVTKVKG